MAMDHNPFSREGRELSRQANPPGQCVCFRRTTYSGSAQEFKPDLKRLLEHNRVAARKILQKTKYGVLGIPVVGDKGAKLRGQIGPFLGPVCLTRGPKGLSALKPSEWAAGWEGTEHAEGGRQGETISVRAFLAAVKPSQERNMGRSNRTPT